jgi:hypothetical protein
MRSAGAQASLVRLSKLILEPAFLTPLRREDMETLSALGRTQ